MEVRSQLGLTHSQTMKAKKRPTRRMMAKPQNLQIRNQSKNVATGHDLDLGMVKIVMTRTFSPRVERPSIPRTTFPFIAFRELAGYFSHILSICSKIARRCQTSTSTPMLLWSMDPLYRVVSGQVYPGTLTHLMLELPHKICLGSSKYAVHSSQRVCAIQHFLYPNRLHLAHHIRLQKTSDIFPLWGVYVKYPLPTEWGTCAMATGISEMGGPHVEDSLSSWTRTKLPSSGHLCLYCNRSHNSRDSLMNHIGFHYRMVLVCPICGGCGSNRWRIVKGHIKKCAVARPNVADRVVEPGEPHWRKSDPPLRNHTTAAETEATYTLSVRPDPPNDEDATD